MAVAEYTRAHRLLPRDDLTSLCLATSYLNLATSRTVQDRHAAVLRAFAVMSNFADQRRRTSELVAKLFEAGVQDDTSAEKKIDVMKIINNVFEAEILYNLAR